MTQPTTPGPKDAPLNPALKQETDRTYDTDTSSPAPIDTTSASENEGEGWPWVWLIVTLICLLAAIVWLI